MGSLNQALAGKQVYLDVNIFIYALEGMEPWASLLRQAFTGMETGEWQAVTSELSLAESLVRPFQLGRQDLVQLYRAALSNRDCLRLVPLDASILVSAARLRALHGFKLPDAMHAATAQAQGFDILPALKDGDSCCQTAMPRRENVFGRVHVPIMCRSALAARPFPYSQTRPTFRTAGGDSPAARASLG